jgi:hypothetical protein
MEAILRYQVVILITPARKGANLELINLRGNKQFSNKKKYGSSLEC